jgi:hypothetical protein
MEVVGSHFAQLVAPVLLFLPQPIATFAGVVMAGTQAWLVLSGNFSWLNLVTIVLAVSAFDDTALRHVLPLAPKTTTVVMGHDVVVLAVTALVAVLSYRPARNLVSRVQLMNASFDPLHLVNTYGAFGRVTRERFEVAVEGTDEEVIGPDTVWREYAFRGKPTDPMRRPRQWAPYHLRLDWLMWFAGLSPAFAHRRWFVPFMVKLLTNDRATLRLLGKSPFPDRPPRAVRALLYHYRFTTWRERRETKAWWVRTLVDEYMPPVGLTPGDESRSSVEGRSAPRASHTSRAPRHRAASKPSRGRGRAPAWRKDRQTARVAQGAAGRRLRPHRCRRRRSWRCVPRRRVTS